MKKILFIFFIACVSGSFAQNDTLRAHRDTVKRRGYYKNMISVNASSFMEKMFKSSVTPDLSTSFLYYTRNFNKFFLRVGVNGSNSKNTVTNVKTSEQTITTHMFTSASLAFYIRKNIGRSFSVAYGLNLFGAYADSSVSFVTPYDEVKNYQVAKHYGIAPGVLLQYKINRRISVFAEYILPIQLIDSKSGTKYSLFPDENTNDRNNRTFSMQVYNPLSIFVSCSF